MSESQPGYNPELEQSVEFDETEAWEKLSEIASGLFPDLPEEEITYLAGLGVDMSLAAGGERRETHTEDFFEALGQVQTLAIGYGVEEELDRLLTEAEIY